MNTPLEALRAEMRRVGVDAVIIPGTDPHQSEYISDHWKFRDYITGFTGSNGTAVVTLDDAALWTDSRYFLQAAAQLEGSGVEMRKEQVPGEPTITEWLSSAIGEDGILALDGKLFSAVEVNRYEQFCAQMGFRLATNFDAADRVWSNRPARPTGKAFVHSEALAGETVDSKIARTMEIVEQNGADALFISSLDDIAWLFNLRGSDVLYTPVVIAFAYLSDEERVLFIDSCKITDEVAKHLKSYNIKVVDYDKVEHYLERISTLKNVMIDPNKVCDTLATAMPCGKVFTASPVAALKGVKNDVQIEGFRSAMERDGAALVRAFRRIENEVASGNVTEITVAEYLAEERAKMENYVSDSFATIAGYADHGAIVHYEAEEGSEYTLAPKGLLLIDSGAQYLDGTTDITRTITLGNPTDDEKHDFTLVLKGHLALARAKFPAGTRGSQLDVLARGVLWAEGKGFLHGTGHGVGHFLGVHEGPQSIRMQENPTPLVPGMVTSNEPGLYIAGSYGIRTENLILTKEWKECGDMGRFLCFEDLTLFPYDTRLIDLDMLSREDVAQINAYHATVRSRLSPYLSGDDLAWLEEKTKEI